MAEDTEKNLLIKTDTDNERLKPLQENLTGVITEKLKPFPLKKVVWEIVTEDPSTKPGYQKEVGDNKYVPGITYTFETWDGGSRGTRSFDERYQARDEYGNQVGDFEVTFNKGDPLDYNHLEVKISVHSAGGFLTQEITCTTERASRASLGETPLMEGEFFKWAGSGEMRENTLLTTKGQESCEKIWYKMEYLGPSDRYQTRVVTEKNGVVESGTGQHGIMLGYTPKMEIVFNPS